MAQNTMNNNATVNTTVVAMAKEEIVMKTKSELRVALEAVGVEMSNTTFKKTKKAELVAMLEKYLDPSNKVENVEASDTVVEEKKKDTGMSKYMDAKWDKLVNAVVAEYVKQSVGMKWALFYRNTKSTVTTSKYLVKSNKLWGATSKVIKSLYGEKNCNEENIKQTLNALVIRGYLHFQKVEGKNGTNIIFSASTSLADILEKASK